MAHEPVVMVVWGDSIAAGNEQFRWPALMESSMNVLTNVGRNVKVVNQGFCGMPAAVAKTRFTEHVLAHQPELVIIQFGFNDMRYDGSRGHSPISTAEEYHQHLSEMIQACRNQAKAQVLLLGNHKTRRFDLMPDGARYDETRARYNEIARRVARNTSVYYLDMATAIEATGENWKSAVGDDGVHLSQFGAYLYVQIIAAEVRRIQAKKV